MKKSLFRPTVLLLIMLMGLLFRLAGINWGMPYAFHPDERLLVARGIHFLSGDLNPHLFLYPSLQMYLLAAVNLVVFFGGWLLGAWQNLLQFTAHYPLHLAVFYLPGRFLTILLSTASLYALYRTGRLMFDHRTGLLAAFFLALMPAVIQHSYYVTTDVPTLPFLLIAFYYLVKISRSPQLNNYYLAAIFIGLAAGIKYNAGLMVALIPLAHLLQNRWQLKTLSVGRLWFALLTAPLIFLLTSPYVLFDWPTFLADFKLQLQNQAGGLGPASLGLGDHHLFYVTHVWRALGGSPFWLLSLLSIGFWGITLLTIKNHRSERLLALTWIFLYWLLIGLSNICLMRYFIPLAPFICLSAADAVITGIGAADRQCHRLGRWGIIALTATSVAYLAAYAVTLSIQILKPDARITAKRWIEKHIPTGATIGSMISPIGGLRGRDDPPLEQGRFSLFQSREVAELIAKQPDYLLLSSYDYGDLVRLGDSVPQWAPHSQAVRALLNGETDYRLLQTFDRAPTLCGHRFLGRWPLHDMMYCFPTILVFHHGGHVRQPQSE